MKYKVHNASIHEVSTVASIEGENVEIKRESVQVEMVPVPDYGRSFTHVILSKGPEDTAAILARFLDSEGAPVETEFEIEPAAA